jgi:hypothetical protein
MESFMNTHSFRNEELISFVNKVLQDLRVTRRATDVLPYAPGHESIQFSGKDIQFSAKLSDFGMGDIGISALTVRTGDYSKTFDDHPALSARLLPRKEDFLSYQTGLVGQAVADAKVASIAAISGNSSEFQMADEPKVIKDGKTMSLAQFMVLRPVLEKEHEQAVGISI